MLSFLLSFKLFTGIYRHLQGFLFFLIESYTDQETTKKQGFLYFKKHYFLISTDKTRDKIPLFL